MDRRSIIVALSSLLLAGSAGAGNADAAPAVQAPERDATTLLVKFKDPAQGPVKVKALGDDPLVRTRNGVEVVRIQSGESLDAKLAAYGRRTDVAYAEPNFIRRATALPGPNDPSYSSQWGLSTINALGAWTIYPGSYASTGGVPVAVVDTGVNSGHADLSAKVRTDLGADCSLWWTTNCASSFAFDDHGHGTHVAGIAAASTNNGVGVSGVAVSSPIIPVKVLSSSGSGSDAGVANGIIWAAQHGARVINLSLGGPGYSTTLCNAVATAVGMGAVVVAAAGNDATSTLEYPAACPGAIGVSATDSFDGLASFSNFGQGNVFVAAPGVGIYSTYLLYPYYASLSGTSMATPFVTGLVALLLSQKPDRTPADVKLLLATTSDKVGGLPYGSDPYGTCGGCTWNQWFGYGRIDAQRALDALPHFVEPHFTLTAGSHLIATGPGTPGGPHVRAFYGSDGSSAASFYSFDPTQSGGARVAVGDVNGDGTADLVAAAGRGAAPLVRVFDGATGAVLSTFYAYDSSFTGGVFVAAGDVNGDGKADIVTGAGPGGGPHVKVFSGADGSLLQSFFAYAPSFGGGVFVAAGDVDGDGKADIVTGAGAGGGPHVKVFSGADGTVLRSFLAYASGFSGGVRVAAGDVNGDGKADVITGPGPGGGPHVEAFSGADGSLLKSFFAFSSSFTGGVNVGAGDANGDGKADIIAGAGPGGGPHVQVFDGATGAVLRSFFAYDPSFTGGVFVAGN